MTFEVGLINGDIYIYSRLTPVAMATKFGTKLAITWFVQQISQDPCIWRRVEGLAIRWRQSKSTTANPDFQL